MTRSLGGSGFGVLSILLLSAGCGTGVDYTTECHVPQVECGGACVDLQTDRAHCGACDEACETGEVCVDGACATSCPAGQDVCDDRCVELQTDRAHCGACDEACETGEVCVDGACATSCPGAQIECGGSCIDPDTDRAYCGASGDCTGTEAGAACADGEVCVDGACATSCP
ncbi:MAG: hypothetical protein JXB32_05265, partial [Deltaproteobacteria bacterium]|nr:hypothetical protein [Deltaproteobacteria bacterium]